MLASVRRVSDPLTETIIDIEDLEELLERVKEEWGDIIIRSPKPKDDVIYRPAEEEDPPRFKEMTLYIVIFDESVE